MKYKFFYEKQFRQLLNSSGLASSNYYILDHFSYKVIGFLIKHGNRHSAMSTFLSSLSFVKKVTLMSPIYFLRVALLNLKSLFSVITVYKGKWVSYRTSFRTPTSQLKQSIRLLLQLANKLRSDHPELDYSQCLALAILNCYFKHGSLFKDLRRLHLKIKNKKIRFKRDSKNKFKIRFRRTRKNKGFYYLNKYGLYKRIVPLS